MIFLWQITESNFNKTGMAVHDYLFMSFKNIFF